ncbi:MAG: hypothetical protein AAGU27_08835 [Dehalobacterium sp.]
MRNSRYSFRLLDEDSDIEKALTRLDGQKKSKLIREALKFYVSFGDMLKNIEENIKQVRQIAEEGILLQNKPERQEYQREGENKRNEIEVQLSEADQFLANSIKNLLEI